MLGEFRSWETETEELFSKNFVFFLNEKLLQIFQKEAEYSEFSSSFDCRLFCAAQKHCKRHSLKTETE